MYIKIKVISVFLMLSCMMGCERSEQKVYETLTEIDPSVDTLLLYYMLKSAPETECQVIVGGGGALVDSDDNIVVHATEITEPVFFRLMLTGINANKQENIYVYVNSSEDKTNVFEAKIEDVTHIGKSFTGVIRLPQEMFYSEKGKVKSRIYLSLNDTKNLLYECNIKEDGRFLQLYLIERVTL